MPQDASHTVRVWDLPTRVFHWALAACVIGLVTTGYIGGDAMPWHGRIGYAVGSLLMFRLLWGFLGGHWSRFSAFPPSPAALLRYLRTPAQADVSGGHSPLGAASVYAMLLFLLLQVATGLFSDDQADYTGPLNILISNRTARFLTGYHQQVGQYVLIALVVLHVAAILYYHFRKGRNLTRPMIGGDQLLPSGTPSSRDDAVTRWKALALFALSCTAMTLIVRLGGASG